MRIWHQSFTDLTVMPLYRKTIAEHASAVMGNDAAVSVHGLRPGTYAEGCAPIDAIKYRYVASINGLQIGLFRYRYFRILPAHQRRHQCVLLG